MQINVHRQSVDRQIFPSELHNSKQSHIRLFTNLHNPTQIFPTVIAITFGVATQHLYFLRISSVKRVPDIVSIFFHKFLDSEFLQIRLKYHSIKSMKSVKYAHTAPVFHGKRFQSKLQDDLIDPRTKKFFTVHLETAERRKIIHGM